MSALSDKIFMLIKTQGPLDCLQLTKLTGAHINTVSNHVNGLHNVCRTIYISGHCAPTGRGRGAPQYSVGLKKPDAPYIRKPRAKINWATARGSERFELMVDSVQDVEPKTLRLEGRVVHLSGVKHYREFDSCL